MGILKLEKLPKEAVPLTRSADIKLVLDTPKGMFFMFFISTVCHLSFVIYINASKERAWETKKSCFCI